MRTAGPELTRTGREIPIHPSANKETLMIAHPGLKPPWPQRTAAAHMRRQDAALAAQAQHIAALERLLTQALNELGARDHEAAQPLRVAAAEQYAAHETKVAAARTRTGGPDARVRMYEMAKAAIDAAHSCDDPGPAVEAYVEEHLDAFDQGVDLYAAKRAGRAS